MTMKSLGLWADKDWWTHRPPYSSDKYKYHPKTIQAYTPPVKRTVRVLKADGTPDEEFEVPATHSDWWNIAIKYFEEKDGVIEVPIDLVGFTYDPIRFNACTFTALDDYLKSRWGRALHYTDKEWLSRHPLSTDDGVPMAYTPICLQELLEPYELGVSRIRVPRGSLVAGKHMRQFIQALGCNPLALVDHTTTNAEAAEKLGLDLAIMDPMWRFEFHDEPFSVGGCVVGSKGFQGAGVATGAFGGHAIYHAPRSHNDGWVLAIQFAPKDTIRYSAPIEYPEYKVRTGPRVLSLNDVKDPKTKKPLARQVGYRWVEVATEPASTATYVPETTVVKQHDFFHTPQPVKPGRETCDSCLMCNTPLWETEPLEDATMICSSCWNEAWKSYKCPSCDKDFELNALPKPVDIDQDKKTISFACSHCGQWMDVEGVDPVDDLQTLVSTALALGFEEKDILCV